MKHTSIKFFSKLSIGTLAASMILPVYATAISYQVTALGSNTWEYEYSVTNDTLGFNIEQFSIFFDHALYNNLQVTSSLAAWDELTVNPAIVFGIADDGFYDALTLMSGVTPGNTEDGFSVSFDWLGSGTPGAQYFQIINPNNFNVLDSASTVPIPAAGTLMLVGAGMLGMTALRKRKKKAGLHA